MDKSRVSGCINGSPVCGLEERMCIEVPRVFDGCQSRFLNQNETLRITDITPGAVCPFTYQSVACNGECRIEDLAVACVNGCRAQVSCEIVIPVIVYFLDANGKACTGKSCITVPRDVSLKIPEPSLTPYTVRCTSCFNSGKGYFINETTLNAVVSYAVVIKIVSMVDIVVPAYGNCIYPVCENSGNDGCCSIANLPIFPSAQNDCKK